MKKTQEAQKYIYRNLTSNCFSIRLRGKVIERFTSPVILVGGFQVSEKGRAWVVKNKKKMVHAYVTTRHSITPFVPEKWESFVKREVVYNPYKNESFVYADTGEKCYGALIVMDYPKVYSLEGYEKVS